MEKKTLSKKEFYQRGEELLKKDKHSDWNRLVEAYTYENTEDFEEKQIVLTVLIDILEQLNRNIEQAELKSLFEKITVNLSKKYKVRIKSLILTYHERGYLIK